MLVAAIVASIAASGVGGVIASNLERAICEVGGSGDCGEAGGTAPPEEAAAPASQAARPSAAGTAATGAGDDRAANPERAEDATAAAPDPGFAQAPAGPAEEVPGAPEPPPPPPGNADGSGEFDSVDPGFFGDIENEALEELAYRGADLFEALGREDAARHMRHFLGESGEPLEVDPARMLRDIEFFRELEQAARDDLIADIQQEAARRYAGEPFSFTVEDRGWEGVPSSEEVLGPNWFFALGGFSFTHTAVAHVTPPDSPGEPPQVEIEYQTHVFDRYNWDKGKSVEIGPVTISDEELQELHRAGMAQDFDVYGSTETETVTVDADPDASGGAPAPTPPAPEGEGGRRDPGRERGSDDRREPPDRDREGRGGR